MELLKEKEDLLSLDEYQDKKETIDTLETLNEYWAEAALASATSQFVQPEADSSTLPKVDGVDKRATNITQEISLEDCTSYAIYKANPHLNNRERKKLQRTLMQVQNTARVPAAGIHFASDSCTTTYCITTKLSITRCALREKCADGKRTTDAVRSIQVQCTESCRVEYHYPLCWKTIVNSRWSQKDEVNQEKILACLTPDCSGDVKLLRYMENETVLRVIRKQIALKKPTVANSTAGVRATQLRLRPRRKESVEEKQKIVTGEIPYQDDHQLLHNPVVSSSSFTSTTSCRSATSSCSLDGFYDGCATSSPENEKDKNESKQEEHPAQLVCLPDEEDEFKELIFWQTRDSLKLPEEMEKEDEMGIDDMEEKVEKQLKQLFDDGPDHCKFKTRQPVSPSPSIVRLVKPVRHKQKVKPIVSLMLLNIPIDWTEVHIIQLLNLLFAPLRNGPKVNHIRVCVVQSRLQGSYGYIICKYVYQAKLIQHLFQQYVEYQRQLGECTSTKLWTELRLVSSAV